MAQEQLKVGIIGGGGGGAFIAVPHQRAIHFDGTRKVVCGALHQDPKVALKNAKDWHYPIKGYGSYDEMLEEEAKKPKGERIDYVLIVTPNHVHFDPAKKALKKGFPIFCEKPLTITVQESEELCKIVKDTRIPFCVSHTYLGHWSSRLSRHIVKSGLIGEVRWADASYLQGWLADRTEDTGCQQAEWRTDPKQSGASNCGGDIGTHALMQLRYVTGLKIKKVSAYLEKFVKGRELDDHFTTYCELSNGGKALIRASQIAIGHKNDLRLEVNGTKGTLLWHQEEPEWVRIFLPGQPERIYWRGEVQPDDGFLGKLPDVLMAEPTIPPGHSEAFHDAFARLHRCFEDDVRLYNAGKYKGTDGSKYATVDDGRIGIQFIAKAIESNNNDHAWVSM